MSLSLDNKSIFINSFQFLSSSLGSLVKNLGQIDFKHLSQEIDSEVLDLVKKSPEFISMNICMISDSLMKYCLAKSSFTVH